jgi:hypothetical protein
MSASRALNRRLAKTPASTKNQHSDTQAAAWVDLRARTAPSARSSFSSIAITIAHAADASPLRREESRQSVT